MNRQERMALASSFFVFLAGLGLVTGLALAVLTIFSSYLGLLF